MGEVLEFFCAAWEALAVVRLSLPDVGPRVSRRISPLARWSILQSNELMSKGLCGLPSCRDGQSTFKGQPGDRGTQTAALGLHSLGTRTGRNSSTCCFLSLVIIPLCILPNQSIH